jgi:sugar-specific transcriptional regulator TrmB
MNNDDKALMKDIADDLNKKSLEELIYINFNPEHYVNEFTSDGRKANENLLNEVKELNKQYEEKKAQYESIKSNIENCKAQYEQKENELKNLYQQKQNIESNVTVEKLIQELGNYIQQNFYQPKEQLVKDFLNKKIDFETFKNQFKDLSLKFHYYSIIKDKLNLCK